MCDIKHLNGRYTFVRSWVCLCIYINTDLWQIAFFLLTHFSFRKRRPKDVNVPSLRGCAPFPTEGVLDSTTRIRIVYKRRQKEEEEEKKRAIQKVLPLQKRKKEEEAENKRLFKFFFSSKNRKEDDKTREHNDCSRRTHAPSWPISLRPFGTHQLWCWLSRNHSRRARLRCTTIDFGQTLPRLIALLVWSSGWERLVCAGRRAGVARWHRLWWLSHPCGVLPCIPPLRPALLPVLPLASGIGCNKSYFQRSTER